MDEELDQIEKNDTWELVPRPKNKNVISTKWVFRNKLNEYGQVVGRLVVVIDVNPSHGFWTTRLMKLFGHEGK
jgi:hypothetical protein